MYDPKQNPLHEIVLVSLALGTVIGTSSTFLLYSLVIEGSISIAKYTPIVIVYGIVIPGYFLSEFLMTCLYQNSRVHSRSFLIYGNRGNVEFWLMQSVTLWEFFMVRSTFLKRFVQLPDLGGEVLTYTVGGLMIVLGLGLRSLAMKTCGKSFSHYIQTELDSRNSVSTNARNTLVQHGVYSLMRHPSYTGFWLLVMGLQIFLRNWICFVVNFFVLRKFFTVRIKFEEWHLVKMYGEDYEKYRRRVGVWIPVGKTR